MDWISPAQCLSGIFFGSSLSDRTVLPELQRISAAGSNIYNFSYYGLYNPIVLVAYLLPL